MLSPLRTHGPALLVLAAATGACSSHATPANSVSGTLGDAGLSVMAEWANVETYEVIPSGYSNDGGPDGSAVIPPAGTGTAQLVTVVLSNNVSFTCTAEKNGAGNSFANLGALRLEVTAEGAVKPSTYTIGASANPTAAVFFRTTDDHCDEGQGAVATSGTVTVSVISAMSVSGTFSVTFGANAYVMQPALGTLTGTFDVPLCALADAGTPEIPDAGFVCHP